MQKNKKTAVAVAVLLVLIVGFGLLWVFMGPSRETNTLEKTVTVTVVHADGSEKEFILKTEAEYLGEVLLSEGLVEGDAGPYGLYITAADGETADGSAEQWWCLADKDGNMLMTSADATAINDGDAFRLVLTTGYDAF